MIRERRNLRKRLLGFGGGTAAGPVLAVPVPVGGRLPALVDGAGGVLGAAEGGICVDVGVGFVVAVAWMGPVATPATVFVLSPAMLPV